MEITRINRDVNGNPRYVVHFLEIDDNYEKAVKMANVLGGKKYNTKSYGGGIVFQSYNTNDLKAMIKEMKRPMTSKDMEEMDEFVKGLKPKNKKVSEFLTKQSQAKKNNKDGFMYKGSKYVKKTNSKGATYYKKSFWSM